ncbi:hypothetical protein BCR43DRAFT_482519 [Syncephalastrum racemosum]|uniref:RRM domain-containing protein n=1 Tax=Syncephalastrum racemosum TaxID=13706 RepID=A0A1X2HTW8_SYNRA|nr:hypothetical protein BCR43DRAFT_482519 [Syncephalastrum racemosum]
MSFKAAKRILPTQIYFHASRPIPSLSHARSVFRSLGQFGEMAEYRFMRCPETQKYLQYGFVIYRNKEDAEQALKTKFLQVSSGFDVPCDVALDKTGSSRREHLNDRKDRRNRRQQQENQ